MKYSDDIWWYHMISDHQWYQMTTDDCWCTIWIINLDDEWWWYMMILNGTIEYTWHILTSTDIFWQHLTSLYQHCYARLLLEQVEHKLPLQAVHLRSHWQCIDWLSTAQLRLFKLVGIRFHGGLWKSFSPRKLFPETSMEFCTCWGCQMILMILNVLGGTIWSRVSSNQSLSHVSTCCSAASVMQLLLLSEAFPNFPKLSRAFSCHLLSCHTQVPNPLCRLELP
jgi:hypothetical protein